MSFDWTLNVGHIATLIGVLFVGAGFYYTTKYDNKNLKEDVKDIKSDIRVLNGLVTDMARQVQRQNDYDRRLDQMEHAFDKRLTTAESDIRDIRHARAA